MKNMKKLFLLLLITATQLNYSSQAVQDDFDQAVDLADDFKEETQRDEDLRSQGIYSFTKSRLLKAIDLANDFKEETQHDEDLRTQKNSPLKAPVDIPLDTKKQVQALSTDELYQALPNLSNKQLGYLSAVQLNGSSAAQLANFTESQVHALSKGTVKGLNDNVIIAFGSHINKKLKKNKLNSDQKTVLKKAIATGKVDAIATKDLTDDDIVDAQDLKEKEVKALSTDELYQALPNLSNNQLGYLSATQLNASSDAQLANFTESQLHALNKGTVKGLDDHALLAIGSHINKNMRGNKLTSSQKKTLKKNKIVYSDEKKK